MGSLGWSTFLGSAGDDISYALSTSSNKLFLTGASSEGGGTPIFPLVDPGGGAYFSPSPPSAGAHIIISEFDINSIVLTINEQNTNSNDIEVYPNPSEGNITIRLLDNPNPMKIQIVNLLGEIVYEKIENPIGSHIRLNLTNLANGAYFIKINGNSNQYVTKVIKR
jgi:hypothetical protein